jgi:5'-methylthioadenosine phosphorylase
MKGKLGIIGGTGFYDLVDLENLNRLALNTPYGEPSDEFLVGEKYGKEIVFLPRHGKNHTILPFNVNYRANIYGMKKLGVTHVISVSTVGSFREEIVPGSIVFIDQYFDRTKDQAHGTFFDEGVVIHISFGDPVCSDMHSQLLKIARELNVNFTPSGTYVNIAGPAFSTRAESKLYRSWGMSVIGMTNMYEAKLCREAELHFATIAQVTDYDSWKTEAVDVQVIMANLKKATESAGKVVNCYIERFPFEDCNCACHTALGAAIVSDINQLVPSLKKKYAIFLDKYFN